MELLLELCDTTDTTAGIDVRVDIDPDETVEALTDALNRFARSEGRGVASDRPALLRTGRTTPLPPSATVLDTGLVSGETVMLADGGALASVPTVRGNLPPLLTRRLPAWHRRRQRAAAGTGRGGPAVGSARGSSAGGPGGRGGPGGPAGRGAGPGAGAVATLDITAGPAVGRVIPLSRDLIVGRAAACTVVIDDPSLEDQHFALRRDGGGILVVPNPGATHATTVDGEPLEEPRELQPGDVITAGSSTFVVRGGVSDETRRRDRLGQVPFNRVPYRRTMVRPTELPEIAPPPQLSTPGKLSLATAFLPAASAAGMAVMFGSYIFLIIAAGTPVLLLLNHIATKRGGKRRFRKEKAAFFERIEQAVEDLAAAQESERQRRDLAAPDLAELARQAMAHMPRLWERDRVAGDLLDLRLGRGELPSLTSIRIGQGGEDDLRAEGEARLAHQATIPDVPVTIDLLDVGLVGLWGDRDHVAATGRALVAQAACLHSPEDLVMAAAVGPETLAGFEWMKWLPHVRSTTSPLEGPYLAVAAEATRSLMASLLAVAADRSERGQTSTPSAWPRVLLVLDEAAEPDRALLSQLLDIAPSYGIHVLWLGESDLQVPRQCRAVVACPGKLHPGRVRFTDPSRADLVVDLDGADAATTRAIARSLAPLRDASASSPTTAIPRVVPLFDVVGLERPDADAVAERWRAGAGRGYGLAFPVGATVDGVLELDLVEQGPHALIGGTSGAGKSELLQTLVLSLAANYPPTRLTFLFVDYKGGASSAEFRDLPHTVGYVTNLDGRMSMRALTSLRAELQRRMTLMEGRAKDLAEMLSVVPREAPPSLVIVVDEFATLVKEIPDFVAGMVDIAQRGRSLGVHLILATQRPTGAVSNNILANTNLRIALRMLDPADSQSILGTKDAADIPVPLRGRAYARTGPKTLVPFQGAWSGARATIDQSTTRVVEVAPFAFVPGDGDTAATAGGGAGGPADAGGSSASGGSGETTQLEVLVEACAGAAGGLPAPRRPWVEPLPEVLPLDQAWDRAPLDDMRRDPGRLAVLGLYDDPENQAQHVATVDLEAAGGLVVFGTGGTGKTTLLRTLAVGLARQGTPDEVQLYVLDFASRSLDPLLQLPHCGAVIAGDEVERTARLFTVLEREIDRRRRILAAARVESLGALRRQGRPAAGPDGAGLPRIVVLLDSYSGFQSTFERSDRFPWTELFGRLVSAGRQVGIHAVITNDRRMGIPTALMSAIGARVALRMATGDDLAALGVPLRVANSAELPDGRGFLDGSTEVQLACVSEDPAGVAQATALSRFAEELSAGGAGPSNGDGDGDGHGDGGHGDGDGGAGGGGGGGGRPGATHAPDLPELPAYVELAPAIVGSLAETSHDGVAGPLTAPFGLVDLSLGTAVANLRRQNMVVLGPPLSGKSTALATLAHGLRATTGGDLHLCALGTPVSPLQLLDVWDDAAFVRTEHADLLQRVADELIGADGSEVRAVLFVDAAEDVEAPDVVSLLDQLSAHDALRWVVAADPGTLSRSYAGWTTNLRRNRNVLLLQPEDRIEAETIIGIRPELRPDQPFPPGRGLFVANRRCHLVQVAQTDPHLWGADLAGRHQPTTGPTG